VTYIANTEQTRRRQHSHECKDSRRQFFVNYNTDLLILKQGVALTGRNTTGPPWSVGRPTACSVTDDDRCQRAKQYWPNRRADNKWLSRTHHGTFVC